MILSHKHKFIFLRTCKTASSSIEIALSRHCGPDDILTPDREEDEKIRKEQGGLAPQNYNGDIPLTTGRYWKDLIQGRSYPKFFHHMQAAELKHYITPDIWNSYYKFAFERNPWDRAVSLYFWRYQNEPRPGFREFIDKGRLSKTVKRQGRNVYHINGKIAVDRVCLYENLDQELEILCRKIGLPMLDLPRTKSTQRKDKKHYTEFMNDYERDRIGKIFKKEINDFGYAFGDESKIRAWEKIA